MRVHIREHIPSDLAASLDWQTDPEMGRHLSWLPRTHLDATASFQDALHQHSVEPRERFSFAVALDETDEMIGDVVYTMDESGTGRCGWFIRRRYWGHGYATEAVATLIDYAFSAQQLETLTASCRSKNVASRRVMEKNGFLLQEQSDSRLWFSLTRSDWSSSR